LSFAASAAASNGSRCSRTVAVMVRLLAHVPAKWGPVRRQEYAPL
jgi:hypothetical protein